MVDATMADQSIRFLLLFMLLRMGLCVRIEIHPQPAIERVNSAVEVSCAPDDVDSDKMKTIVLMEISKDNANPLTMLRESSKVTYGSRVSRRYQAEGVVNKNISTSYLNLKILHPVSDDSGTYKCLVFYVDDSGLVKDEMATEDVVVSKPDVAKTYRKVQTLEAALDKMNEKIKSLEKHTTDIAQKIVGTTEKVTRLATDNIIQSNQMTQLLKDKDKLSPAFSATNTVSTYITDNLVLVFNEVVMRQGQGYDETTGIFTAPRPGLYAFQLVVTLNDGAVLIYLYANDVDIARLYARDHLDKWDQSSVSAVVKLQKGDKVKAVVEGTYDSKPLFNPNKYSQLTGYLVSPF